MLLPGHTPSTKLRLDHTVVSWTARGNPRYSHLEGHSWRRAEVVRMLYSLCLQTAWHSCRPEWDFRTLQFCLSLNKTKKMQRLWSTSECLLFLQLWPGSKKWLVALVNGQEVYDNKCALTLFCRFEAMYISLKEKMSLRRKTFSRFRYLLLKHILTKTDWSINLEASSWCVTP